MLPIETLDCKGLPLDDLKGVVIQRRFKLGAQIDKGCSGRVYDVEDLQGRLYGHLDCKTVIKICNDIEVCHLEVSMLDKLNR